MLMSELIADAIIKRTSPVQDDISERQCHRSNDMELAHREQASGIFKSAGDSFNSLQDGLQDINKATFSKGNITCIQRRGLSK